MSKLRPALFSLKRYYQGLSEVEAPAAGSMGRRQWVVARGLCLYKTFPLSDTPRNERKNLLNVRIMQWSPFAMTGRYVIWHGETAQVWIWDESIRSAALRDQGVSSANPVPETLLNPPAENAMSRIVVCREGFEGQIWTDGLLVASRWWRQEPSDVEWKRFLLGNDTMPEDADPTPDELPWLAKPWGKKFGGLSALDVRREQFWLLAALVLFSFLFTWRMVSIERWSDSLSRLQDLYDQRMDEARPIRTARTRALKFKEESEKIVALVAYPSPLKLMSLVTQRLRSNNAYVIEWRYTKGGLSFIVEGANLDPLYYIDAFQRIPGFTDVTAELDKNGKRLVVAMNIASLEI
jgi:hypothetical protein